MIPQNNHSFQNSLDKVASTVLGSDINDIKKIPLIMKIFFCLGLIHFIPDQIEELWGKNDYYLYDILEILFFSAYGSWIVAGMFTMLIILILACFWHLIK